MNPSQQAESGKGKRNVDIEWASWTTKMDIRRIITSWRVECKHKNKEKR